MPAQCSDKLFMHFLALTHLLKRTTEESCFSICGLSSTLVITDPVSLLSLLLYLVLTEESVHVDYEVTTATTTSRTSVLSPLLASLPLPVSRPPPPSLSLAQLTAADFLLDDKLVVLFGGIVVFSRNKEIWLQLRQHLALNCVGSFSFFF